MAKAKAAKKTAKQQQNAGHESVAIHEYKEQSAHFHLLGTTPILLNRMSQKVAMELLFPRAKGKGSRVGLKHDPLREFRDSAYTSDVGPTLIQGLGVWVKLSVAQLGTDTAGLSRAALKRDIRAEEERINIYGVPQLHMGIVRMADMNRTPDVRTRMIVPRWCTEVTLSWPSELLTYQSMVNLVARAGRSRGLGDWRQERGGSFGLFEIVDKDNAEYKAIKKLGRSAQEKAIENPQCYDDEAAELLSWFKQQLVERDAEVTTEGYTNGRADEEATQSA